MVDYADFQAFWLKPFSRVSTKTRQSSAPLPGGGSACPHLLSRPALRMHGGWRPCLGRRCARIHPPLLRAFLLQSPNPL